MAVWAQSYFLNPNSMVLFFLAEYHNLTMFLMTNILVFLLAMLILLLSGTVFSSCPWKEDNKTLEILWTIFPAYWLVMLAVPSLGNLYRMDLSKCEYEVLFKAIGNQWYWSYEYSMEGLGSSLNCLSNLEGNSVKGSELSMKIGEMYTFNSLEKNLFGASPLNVSAVLSSCLGKFFYCGGVSFVSYMEDPKELNLGDYRLLEVDNRVICPGLANVRVNITSADVIHSWTMPAMGVKVDAVPGRLNCATFKTLDYGVFYGQCSEMCGAKHSFMPICLEAIPFNWFRLWMKEFQVGA
uniref:Cytochrome c oxidase subunit 2 n=1 Tax=Thyasira tokunagai TaxID=3055801 RepID=A0AB39CC80_9BIVA